jgi:hypothetical protein
MTCTYCQTKNSEDCLYCPNCGKPTGSSVDAVDNQTPSTGKKLVSSVVGNTKKNTKSDSPAIAASSLVAQQALTIPSSSPDMPGPKNAQLAQANLCRLRKNWSDATELCIAVLRENPADPAAHSVLGDIYRDQNRLDEAVRWYRMALELSPNPFDQANLQKLERKLSARNLAYGSGGNSGSAPGAFDPTTGSLAGGTNALMGITPQKWLRGITVSALSFLCLFVIYLLALPTRKVSPIPRAISSEALVSEAGSGSNALPPAVLSGPTSLPAGEQSTMGTPTARVAGTGLPPDRGTATVQTLQPQSGDGVSVSNGIAPAAVKDVTPMGAAGVSGRVGVITQSPSQTGIHSNGLTGGIQAGPVDSGRGAATIQLIASNAAASRDVLIRNLYRAARTVFSNDSTLQRATVTIHSESSDGSILLAADIDRASALVADPDNDDISTLTGRLHIH